MRLEITSNETFMTTAHFQTIAQIAAFSVVYAACLFNRLSSRDLKSLSKADATLSRPLRISAYIDSVGGGLSLCIKEFRFTG